MLSADLIDLLKTGLQLHQEGHFPAAEAKYRIALEIDPSQFDGLRLLGILLRQQGRLDESLPVLLRARDVNPNSPEIHNDVGLLYLDLGDFASAQASLEKAISLKSPSPEALYNLGNCLFRRKRLDEAADAFRQAYDQDPSLLEALYNLGLIAQEQGKAHEAIKFYRRAIEDRPDFTEALVNLALAHATLGNISEAQQGYRKTLKIQPDNKEALLNLAKLQYENGQIDDAHQLLRRLLDLDSQSIPGRLNYALLLENSGQFDEAWSILRDAAEMSPQNPEVLNAIGVLHNKLNQFSEAADYFRQVIEVSPDFVPAYVNLSGVHLSQYSYADAERVCAKLLKIAPYDANGLINLSEALLGQLRVTEALAYLRDGLEHHPDNLEIEFNLATAELLSGDYKSGWDHYESRWRSKIEQFKPRPLLGERWDGTERKSSTLLIYAEQGFGDTIQFARFIPEVSNRVGRIIFECQPSLIELMRNVPGVSEIIPSQETPPQRYDYHIPLLSIPFVLRTNLSNIPNTVPYIPLPAGCRPEINISSEHLKVGIVWAGNPKRAKDALRSLDIRQISSLFDVPNVAFFSLQLGGTPKILEFGLQDKLTDLSHELADFATTANYLDQLDLLISVDTAVAHLAGALGKPTWLLLAFESDWRWLLNRADSPWYPSLRLFRQEKPMDWKSAIKKVEVDLTQWTLKGRHDDQV